MDRTFLKMWADPCTAVSWMLPPFLVITPILLLLLFLLLILLLLLLLLLLLFYYVLIVCTLIMLDYIIHVNDAYFRLQLSTNLSLHSFYQNYGTDKRSFQKLMNCIPKCWKPMTWCLYLSKLILHINGSTWPLTVLILNLF